MKPKEQPEVTEEVLTEISEGVEELPAETEPVAEPPQTEDLQEEFEQLKQEVPELKALNDLPEAVLREASEQKLPLLDAYLRYRWREQQAVEAERERQKRTGEQTAGSLYTGSTRQNPASDAFSRAFEQALR
ncbi:MAG: hypothetical protein IJN07_03340 [Clostridia bacterium]|nr:hypothetical protein [Clostridia bacterium]